MPLLNCEICLHTEIRAIPSRFNRWTEYRDHMRDVHGVLIKQDGSPSDIAKPPVKPIDEI